MFARREDEALGAQARHQYRAPDSAAGMVVTSIDCLAPVGQPMPQQPRFQQPRTLRGMTCRHPDLHAALAASMPLLAFGATGHVRMPRRCSTCWQTTAPWTRPRVRPAQAHRASRPGSWGCGNCWSSSPSSNRQRNAPQDIDCLCRPSARCRLLIQLGIASASRMGSRRCSVAVLPRPE